MIRNNFWFIKFMCIIGGDVEMTILVGIVGCFSVCRLMVDGILRWLVGFCCLFSIVGFFFTIALFVFVAVDAVVAVVYLIFLFVCRCCCYLLFLFVCFLLRVLSHILLWSHKKVEES